MFPAGRFQRRGHWINANSQGDYTDAYAIRDAPESGSAHPVHRIFLKPDGSTLYEEHTVHRQRGLTVT
jgi:hypothetical protein